MTPALLETEQQFDADSLTAWLSPCVDFERDGERRNRQLAAMSMPVAAVRFVAPAAQPDIAHSGQAEREDADAVAGDTITLTKAELADMIAAHLGENAHAGDAGSVGSVLPENAYEVRNTELGELETIVLEAPDPTATELGPLEDSPT